MKIETEYGIWPRNLDFEKLFTAVAAFASKRKMRRIGTDIFKVEVDSSEKITAHSLDEFQDLFKNMPKYECLYSDQTFEKKDVELGVQTMLSGNTFDLSIRSNEPDFVRLLKAELESDFGLRKAPIPAADHKR